MDFQIWGLSGTLVTEHERQLNFAEERLWHWLNEFDGTCNRFRDDSEISRVNAHAGETVAISATLELAFAAALLAREATDGLCDPSVLPALLALGYAVDYDELKRRDDTPLATPVKGMGAEAFTLDRSNHTVTLAPQCQLDLGASAKALAADLIANDVASTGGVVVEIGGDVAVRGRGPQGLWAIGLSDSLELNGKEPRVAINDGGIATSSTTTRTWRAGGELVNHIIDPRTGSFAVGPYSTATVSASSCVLANAFATASLLWGEDAAYHVAQAGWSARFVRHDGDLEYVGGWPVDEVLA
ncbi:MAG TPA: FAD:protein FMN transferase [Acidimicrobiales bacterium]|jgi:thiamine biosynthesis lipoprotein|nr:FAD:protein FMN transferase [Acidimicrobiales bacterium]